jgi:PII-like signaling protein
VKLEGEQALLRFHLSNVAQWRTAPLYEALVGRAHHERLAGATVLSGIFGFVAPGPILGARADAVRVARPVVVEIVDEEARLARFLESVAPMLAGQQVVTTLERAHVVRYRGGAGGPRP